MSVSNDSNKNFITGRSRKRVVSNILFNISAGADVGPRSNIHVWGGAKIFITNSDQSSRQF